MNQDDYTASVNRRTFIRQAALSAGGLSLFSPAAAMATAANTYTVQQVIDLILKEGGLTPFPETVDTIKAGRADQRVNSIVTTMFPTVAVIEEAARRKANFIIAHEPSFYHHLDNAEWIQDNAVYQQKQALLKKHGMAIWRFHDYCHSLKPDAISYGVAKKAGWLSYYQSGQRVLTLPSMPLQQLAQHLKASLGIAHIRVIGDLKQPCERIALMPGAAGGQRQIALAEAEKPDVLVVGEVSEWETAEYIRDARAMGTTIALIILGHAVSEEPGMAWLVDWLQPKLSGIKVTHIASGDPFTWL